MTDFLVGGATAVVTFWFAYSWLSTKWKRRFNAFFGNPFFDILISVGTLTIAGTTAAGLFVALGIGIGLSLCLKMSCWIFGRNDQSGILYGLNCMVDDLIDRLRR